MLALTITQVVNIGNLDGVLVVREQICEGSLVKGICNDRSVSMNELNLGYSANIVCIGFTDLKANRSLCLCRTNNRDFGSCLCKCGKFNTNAFSIASVEIFRHEFIGGVRKKFVYTRCAHANIFYKVIPLVKLESGDSLVLMILVPKETKAEAFLSNCNIIKQYYRIGIERILIKNVHLEAVTGEVIVITNNCILVESIGFQPIKINGIVSNSKILFCYDTKSIVKHRFEYTF